MNRLRLLLTLCIGLFAAGAIGAAAGPRGQAERILEEFGDVPGVILQIGRADAAGIDLAVALAESTPALVQVLDVDARRVREARGRDLPEDVANRVTFTVFDGRRLPYIEHFANLVVLLERAELTAEEMLRVLAPGGAALARDGAGWQRHVKPRRPNTDDWTHYLYDAAGGAVSRDTVVGPPRRLQWIAGPEFARHHDHMSSASAMVSAGGRVFYIFDHAPAQAILLPSDWRLVARDAYNGRIVWSRTIPTWHSRMQRLKSGPASLTRRLVATEQAVFVTLGLDAPVVALDPATGRDLRTFEGTAGAEEILFRDGRLYVLVNPVDPAAGLQGHIDVFGPVERRIVCLDAAVGKTQWTREAPWVVPGSLAVAGGRAVFYDGEQVVALSIDDGEELWRSEKLGERTPVPSYFTPCVVLHEDLVLFSGADTGQKAYHVDNGKTMTALDAGTGRTLWQAPHPPSGYRSPEDMLVVDDLVWTGDIMHVKGMKGEGEFTGRDLRTGEVKVRFTPDVPERTHWFHHRCYRAKATNNYLLTSRTGIEFVDVRKQHWQIHHWVRGACLYGVMPANGMVYNPPHPCACYLEAKMFGFNALAPASPAREALLRTAGSRLQPGPAYEAAGWLAIEPTGEDSDWPTLRGRPDRAGRTEAPVPADLADAWRTALGGRISAPVIASGRVFVAQIDRHKVHCLDAGSGEAHWAFAAGARVDSPPTVWRGLVLFGSADGHVYCLRAEDGALCWRFRAAPADLRLVAMDQIESVWPVHGTVLVRELADQAEVWAVAGRSMFLDGGLRLVRLDAATGRLISETVMDDRDPNSEKELQALHAGLNMPVALPDVLVDDGSAVYMRSQPFDLTGRRLELDAPMRRPFDQFGQTQHLFCPTGLLDDALWHRSYWIYGQTWKSGAGGYYQAGRFAPAGRPLVFSDSHVYGFGRKQNYYRWTSVLEYELFRAAKHPKRIKLGERRPGFGGGRPPTDRFETDWAVDVPMLVQGMVLVDSADAGAEMILLAGAPDVVDEPKSQEVNQAEVRERLARQTLALAGRDGGVFRVVSAEDGQPLQERKLPHVPVFDGLAAAGGRVYVSLADGSVLCLSGRAEELATRNEVRP